MQRKNQNGRDALKKTKQPNGKMVETTLPNAKMEKHLNMSDDEESDVYDTERLSIDLKSLTKSQILRIIFGTPVAQKYENRLLQKQRAPMAASTPLPVPCTETPLIPKCDPVVKDDSRKPKSTAPTTSEYKAPETLPISASTECRSYNSEYGRHYNWQPENSYHPRRSLRPRKAVNYREKYSAYNHHTSRSYSRRNNHQSQAPPTHSYRRYGRQNWEDDKPKSLHQSAANHYEAPQPPLPNYAPKTQVYGMYCDFIMPHFGDPADMLGFQGLNYPGKVLPLEQPCPPGTESSQSALNSVNILHEIQGFGRGISSKANTPRDHQNQDPMLPTNSPKQYTLLTIKSRDSYDNKENIAPFPILPMKRPIIYAKLAEPPPKPFFGDRQLSGFELMQKIGRGSYGSVYKATDLETKRLVALKKLQAYNDGDAGMPMSVVRELKILRRLQHPNIIDMLNAFVDDSDETQANFIFLVFEYMEHDLYSLVVMRQVHFNEQQIASIMKQLLEALHYCHGLSIMHRDIKSTNILMNNVGVIKLADFGLSRFINNCQGERLYTNQVITLWYRPPELLLGEERYGCAVDIWSCGCILAEMFLKKPLFNTYTEMETLEKICRLCGTPSERDWPGVVGLAHFSKLDKLKAFPRVLKHVFDYLPKPVLELMDTMLRINPEQRLSTGEALKNEWFRGIVPENVQQPQLPAVECHEYYLRTIRHNPEKIASTK